MDIRINDEVVVTATGEHGIVRDLSAGFAEVGLETGPIVVFPRTELALAGEEAR